MEVRHLNYFGMRFDGRGDALGGSPRNLVGHLIASLCNLMNNEEDLLKCEKDDFNSEIYL